MNNLNQDNTKNNLTHDITKSLVQSLLAGFSMEITTKEALTITDFGKVLPKDTEIYIVATPSTKPSNVIDLAKRLHNEGMIPVPHVAARAVPSIKMVDRWLKILCLEANVDRALIVAGGNYEKAVGPFASSLDLVTSRVFIDNGINDLRFAGHPEGHPLLKDSQLIDVLLDKQKFGKKYSSKITLITQFFFDFDAIAKWERSLLQHSVNLPIRVGFHGVVGISNLVRHTLYCGVGASLSLLTKNPSKLVKTTSLANPGKLILGLARHCQNSPDNLFAGCHFFPFGNFESTAEWLNNILQGEFQITNGSIILR